MSKSNGYCRTERLVIKWNSDIKISQNILVWKIHLQLIIAFMFLIYLEQVSLQLVNPKLQFSFI